MNTIFIWSCIGGYWLYVEGNANSTEFEYFFKKSLLGNAIYLGTINPFLYSWHFLEALERNQEMSLKKNFYGKFRKISIFLLPAS
jgi:hypothetical protein